MARTLRKNTYAKTQASVEAARKAGYVRRLRGPARWKFMPRQALQKHSRLAQPEQDNGLTARVGHSSSNCWAHELTNCTARSPTPTHSYSTCHQRSAT